MIYVVSIYSLNFKNSLFKHRILSLSLLCITFLSSAVLFGITANSNNNLPSYLSPLFGAVGLISLLDFILLGFQKKSLNLNSITPSDSGQKSNTANQRRKDMESYLSSRTTALVNSDSKEYWIDYFASFYTNTFYPEKVLSSSEEISIIQRFNDPLINDLLSYSPNFDTIDFLAGNNKFNRNPPSQLKKLFYEMTPLEYAVYCGKSSVIQKLRELT